VAPGLLLFALASALAGEPEPSLNLEIEVRPAGGPPLPRVAEPAGATLFLNGLGGTRLKALARSLGELRRSGERRRNPLFDPLDDSDERALTARLVADLAPALSAALALAAGRWQSPEGELSIHGARQCAPGARCLSLTAPAAQPGDSVDKRSRFLAWPVGYAMLGVVNPASAARAAELLRGPTGDSHIALVLTGDELHSLRMTPAAAAVLREVDRLLPTARIGGSPLATTLEHLAAARSAGDELPWLQLPRTALLIVPRLSALATADAFVAEVRARLGGTKVRWLAVPPPTGAR